MEHNGSNFKTFPTKNIFFIYLVGNVCVKFLRFPLGKMYEFHGLILDKEI